MLNRLLLASSRSLHRERFRPREMSVTNANVRQLPGLLTPSYAYKPFRYPWAYDF